MANDKVMKVLKERRLDQAERRLILQAISYTAEAMLAVENAEKLMIKAGPGKRSYAVSEIRNPKLVVKAGETLILAGKTLAKAYKDMEEIRVIGKRLVKATLLQRTNKFIANPQKVKLEVKEEELEFIQRAHSVGHMLNYWSTFCFSLGETYEQKKEKIHGFIQAEFEETVREWLMKEIATLQHMLKFDEELELQFEEDEK